MKSWPYKWQLNYWCSLILVLHFWYCMMQLLTCLEYDCRQLYFFPQEHLKLLAVCFPLTWSLRHLAEANFASHSLHWYFMSDWQMSMWLFNTDLLSKRLVTLWAWIWLYVEMFAVKVSNIMIPGHEDFATFGALMPCWRCIMFCTFVYS